MRVRTQLPKPFPPSHTSVLTSHSTLTLTVIVTTMLLIHSFPVFPPCLLLISIVQFCWPIWPKPFHVKPSHDLYHSSDISCSNNCSGLIYEIVHNNNTGLQPGYFFLTQRGPLGAQQMTVRMTTTYSLGWTLKVYQEKRFNFQFVQQLFNILF